MVLAICITVCTCYCLLSDLCSYAIVLVIEYACHDICPFCKTHVISLCDCIWIDN